MNTSVQLYQSSPVTTPIPVATHKEREDVVTQETRKEAPVLRSLPFFLGGIGWGLLMVLTALMTHTPTPLPPPLFSGMVYAGITAGICLASFSQEGFGVPVLTGIRIMFLLSAGTMVPFVLCHLAGIQF